MKANINSEIGKLEVVLLHEPGPEVENMTPATAERALYSDILNLSVASKEYNQLKTFLNSVSKTFEIKDLFTTTLNDPALKEKIISDICLPESQPGIIDYLLELAPDKLTNILIEGVPLAQDTLTKYLSQEKFLLSPLHNFFFTRDASFVINDTVFVSRMAKNIRSREAVIMDFIYRYHPDFNRGTNKIESVPGSAGLTLEGGDVIVVNKNVIVIGIGSRTTAQGVDFIVQKLPPSKEKRFIFIQELPATPESFIHLDMVFTLLDRDLCMIYEPLILKDNNFKVVKMEINNGKVISIDRVNNLLDGLNRAGISLNHINCGGDGDIRIQEREQWHSGANFFAFAPGKLIGYERNIHTSEALNKKGFSVLTANEVIQDNINLNDYKRCLITIEGGELARGGGGARCMTMPLIRKDL